MYKFVAAFFILVASVGIALATPIKVDSVTGPLPLLPYFTWFPDPNGKESVETLTSGGFEQRFLPLEKGFPLRGTGPVWLRLLLVKSSPGATMPPDGLVMHLGELPTGSTRLFTPGASSLNAPGVWQTEEIIPHEAVTLPEPGLTATSLFIRMEETPGLWFSPTLSPKNATKADFLLPVYLLPSLVILALVTCLLRSLKERKLWPLWAALFLGCVLIQALMHLPKLTSAITYAHLPSLLAPGLALMILPHIGRTLLGTKKVSPIQDAFLTVYPLVGAAACLAPLLPGYSWLMRLFPLWPLLLIPLIPVCLAAPADRRGSSLPFTGACLLPVAGAAIAFFSMNAPLMHPLAPFGGLWGLVMGGLALALARTPKEVPQNRRLPTPHTLQDSSQPSADSSGLQLQESAAGLQMAGVPPEDLQLQEPAAGLQMAGVHPEGLQLQEAPPAGLQLLGVRSAGLHMSETSPVAGMLPQATAAAPGLHLSMASAPVTSAEKAPGLVMAGAVAPVAVATASDMDAALRLHVAPSISFGPSELAMPLASEPILSKPAQREGAPLVIAAPEPIAMPEPAAAPESAVMVEPVLAVAEPVVMPEPAAAPKPAVIVEPALAVAEGIDLEAEATPSESSSVVSELAFAVAEAAASLADAERRSAVPTSEALLPLPDISAITQIEASPDPVWNDSFSATESIPVKESSASQRVISFVDEDISVYFEEHDPPQTQLRMASFITNGSFVFSLHSLVREVHDAIAAPAQNKGLFFSWYIAPSLPPLLEGDSPNLRQALFLLLQNAVQATQQGVVRLLVHPAPDKPKSDTACTLLFTITDSGAAQRTDAGFFHAWELAARTEGAFTVGYSAATGTQVAFSVGFSLPAQEAISAYYAAQPAAVVSDPFPQHEDLSYASAFPLSEELLQRSPAQQLSDEEKVDSLENATRAFAEYLPPPTSTAHTCPRIMVVDMTTSHRRLLSNYLQNIEHEHVVAQSAEEAVHIFREMPADCIIFDADLPEMDIATAVAAIREQAVADSLNSFIILALTGHAAQAERMYAAGCTHTLQKPFSREELESVVRAALVGYGNVQDASELSAPSAQFEAESLTPTVVEAGTEAFSQALPGVEASSHSSPEIFPQTQEDDFSESAALPTWASEAEHLQATFPKLPSDAALPKEEGFFPDIPVFSEDSVERPEELLLRPASTLLSLETPNFRVASHTAALPDVSRGHMPVSPTGDVAGRVRAVAAPAGKEVSIPAAPRTDAMEALLAEVSAPARQERAVAPMIMGLSAEDVMPHDLIGQLPLVDLTVNRSRKGEGAEQDVSQAVAGAEQDVSQAVAGDMIFPQADSVTPDVTPSPVVPAPPKLSAAFVPTFVTAKPQHASLHLPATPEAEENIDVPESIENTLPGAANTGRSCPNPDVPVASRQASDNLSILGAVGESPSVAEMGAASAYAPFPLAGIDGEFIEIPMLPLLPGLVQTLEDALYDLQSGCANRSTIIAQEAAGRLAGKAEAFGLHRLGKIARCVERAAEANDMEAVSTLYEDLGGATNRYLLALRESHTNFLRQDR